MCQLRFTIAFTLVSAATVLCDEPVSQKFSERTSFQHTAEVELPIASHILRGWLEEMSQPVRRTDLESRRRHHVRQLHVTVVRVLASQ